MAAATQSPHATTETTEAEGHGGGQGGLPQFKFEYWGGQIVFLLIIFAVLYLMLARVFTPRLRKVIDERARTIAEAVETARSVQAEVVEQARAAQAELAEARARSQRLALDARNQASADAAARQAVEDAKLGEHLAKAESRIRDTRDAAMVHVTAIASDIAQVMVTKLTGQPATAKDIAAAELAILEGAN